MFVAKFVTNEDLEQKAPEGKFRRPPEHRGRGCGTALMDWAMQVFRQRGINSIEVKVAAGNDAIRLDEKYGFQLNAQILRLDR